MVIIILTILFCAISFNQWHDLVKTETGYGVTLNYDILGFTVYTEMLIKDVTVEMAHKHWMDLKNQK